MDGTGTYHIQPYNSGSESSSAAAPEEDAAYSTLEHAPQNEEADAQQQERGDAAANKVDGPV